MEMPRLQATAPMARQPVIERMNATVCWAIKALSLSSVATWYESSSQLSPMRLEPRRCAINGPLVGSTTWSWREVMTRVGQLMVGSRSWLTAASA